MSLQSVQETTGYLLVQICRAHRSLAESELEKIGLHAGQEMFLLQLADQQGQAQSQLAEQMCIQPPTLNKMLSRMESSGLVERRTDSEDNRVSRVYLTEKSAELPESIEQIWITLEQRTFASFTLDERVLLRRLLLQIITNLNTEGA